MPLKKTIRRQFIDPFQRFFQRETSGGIVLFLAAFSAVLWAISPLKELYFQFWRSEFTIGLRQFELSLPLHVWINDGLMAIFFLLVGLEIKRQLLVGELSNIRKALFPILAAIGGIVVPGVIYVLFNPPGTPFNKGWAVPTVTDIAFSLGVLALLGKRVPLSLKVFLTALAIADDLGAIGMIALFYSSSIRFFYLTIVGLVVGVLVFLNKLGIRWLPLYLFIGLFLWLMMLHSGIHTTIAGVILAFTIPAGSKIKVGFFYDEGISVLHQLRKVSSHHGKYSVLAEEDYQAGLQNMETLCEEAQAPLQRLEHALHPWVTYGIMPLFAFANAGVSLFGVSLNQVTGHPAAIGIIAGLFLGKQFGIFAFSWLGSKLKLIQIPEGINLCQMYGLACLGGIGFTMSLFIADLAFEPAILDIAKVSIFIASILSGLTGYLLLHICLKASSKKMP